MKGVERETGEIIYSVTDMYAIDGRRRNTYLYYLEGRKYHREIRNKNSSKNENRKVWRCVYRKRDKCSAKVEIRFDNNLKYTGVHYCEKDENYLQEVSMCACLRDQAISTDELPHRILKRVSMMPEFKDVMHRFEPARAKSIIQRARFSIPHVPGDLEELAVMLENDPQETRELASDEMVLFEKRPEPEERSMYTPKSESMRELCLRLSVQVPRSLYNGQNVSAEIGTIEASMEEYECCMKYNYSHIHATIKLDKLLVQENGEYDISIQGWERGRERGNLQGTSDSRGGEQSRGCKRGRVLEDEKSNDKKKMKEQVSRKPQIELEHDGEELYVDLEELDPEFFP